MKKKKQSKENKGKAKGKKKGKKKDKQKSPQDDEITEKEIPEQIGIFNDFLVFGKNNKKEDNNIQDNNNNLHLQRLESEFASFLIIKNEPNQKESRFSSLFKELLENDKKEKQKEEKETEQIKEKKEDEENQKDIFRPKEEMNNIGNETNNKNKNIIIENDSINNNINNIQNDMNRNKGSNKYYNNYFLYTTTYSKNKFNDFNMPDLAYTNTFYSNQDNYMPKMSNFSNSSWPHGSSTNDTTTIFTRYSNSFSNKSNNNSFGNNNTFNEHNNPNNIINNNNFNSVNNSLNNNFNSTNIINDNKNINNSNNNNINNNLQEKAFEPEVKIKKIISLEDQRTSIMIKNIPNKFTRDLLLSTIDQNFKGTYDLFILPTDGSKNKNFGYSFINFISCYFIPYFYSKFNNKNWSCTNSKKICEITYSKIQGRQNLISYYSNKIIFYNKYLKEINNKTEYKIPIEYKNYFLELYPQQIEKISEKDNYFITIMPIVNKV